MEKKVTETKVGDSKTLPRFALVEDGSMSYQGDNSLAENTKQMLEVFGTNNPETMNRFIDQIAQVAGCKDMYKAVEFINQITPTINAIGPKNELEAMLAIQMVGIHTMSMEMMKRAMYSDQTVDGVSNNVNRVTKLTRTFIAQMDVLNKLRGKGQQKMTVEHVHVNKGGQAVIGNVEKGGGNEKKDELPHGPLQCRAKSKQSGKRCRRWATPGKLVCYYHGSRSPGNFKHGAYTKETKEENRRIRALMRHYKETLRVIEG